MPRDPVEFTREAGAQPNQRCGNRVQIEDQNALLLGPGNGLPVSELPVDAAAADVNEPAANTAAVVTYAGVAGVRHVITGMAWSYYGGVPVGRITVQDAGVTVFVTDIADEGCGSYGFPKPKRAALVNTAMVITLAAAGNAAITGKLSILNHWTEV